MAGFPVNIRNVSVKPSWIRQSIFPRSSGEMPICWTGFFGGIVEILIGVRHVEIAADDHRQVCRHLPDVGKECIVEPQLVVEVSIGLIPSGK